MGGATGTVTGAVRSTSTTRRDPGSTVEEARGDPADIVGGIAVDEDPARREILVALDLDRVYAGQAAERQLAGRVRGVSQDVDAQAGRAERDEEVGLELGCRPCRIDEHSRPGSERAGRSRSRARAERLSSEIGVVDDDSERTQTVPFDDALEMRAQAVETDVARRIHRDPARSGRRWLLYVVRLDCSQGHTRVIGCFGARLDGGVSRRVGISLFIGRSQGPGSRRR